MYETLLSFITLTFLEIILGIDNIIFIAIAIYDLPNRYKNRARYIGIFLALLIRFLMLLALSWLMTLTKPLFNIAGLDFSFNNILLVTGGIFLIVKSAMEIYNDVTEAHADKHTHLNKKPGEKKFLSAVMQIVVVDFIFSFDSIITAIGMTKNLPIIFSAVAVSMAVMLFASEEIGKLLSKYPSLKIMALAFIFMIGIILLTDGMHLHVSKNYLYFSLFFALAVESLNIVAKKR